MNIKFRHIKIGDGEKEISGFALCYETLQQAGVIFDILLSGYENNIEKKVFIKFIKESNNTYELKMLVRGNKNEYMVEIGGIEGEYIDELKASIIKSGSIFVVTAKSNTESEFVLTQHKFFCVNEIYIDEERVAGNKIKYVSDLVEQFVN